MWSEVDFKESEIMQAKVELTQLEAMKVLVTNNDLGAEIHVAGLVAGVSVNTNLLPIIEYEIEQINKYLKGDPNTYE